MSGTPRRPLPVMGLFGQHKRLVVYAATAAPAPAARLRRAAEEAAFPRPRARAAHHRAAAEKESAMQQHHAEELAALRCEHAATEGGLVVAIKRTQRDVAAQHASHSRPV